MGYQYNTYPFEMTTHVVYVLKKILEAHDEWGYKTEGMYLYPFADGFKIGRTKEYNISNLLQYLQTKKYIKIIPSRDKDFYLWVKTPIIGIPKMRVHTRWRIQVIDDDRIRSLASSIELRIKEFSHNDLRCDLHVEDRKLYLMVNKKQLELKRFNNRGAIDVFRKLIIERVVERDEDGYIKGKGIGAGQPIGSLSSVVRNSGFKKKARNYLFFQCKDNIIELKTPLYLEGEEINHILDDFVKHNSKNGKYVQNKNRDTLSDILSQIKNIPS
ncbi:MAG: hypothetical protein ABIP50_00945 [Candidatus Saccharimonadales bacterium]